MIFSALTDLITGGKSGLAPLGALSARLGRDPLLVQAASGNTSVKLGKVLWIKASGRWLADAEREKIFVSVDLAQARSRLSHDPTEAAGPCPHRQNDLSPSIETAMHAVLPQRVVIHVHSVNTIAWAVRQDGREQLAERLRGLRWRWIRHVPSGRPLAHEVGKAICALPRTDVFVLANHGLVVCGECCDSAEDLLRDVECRLAIAPRPSPAPDREFLEPIAHALGWKLPPAPALHALGTDRLSRSILEGGVLYPCQAIFLPPSRSILASTAQLTDAIHRYREEHRTCPPFFILEGGGVIISKQITRAEYAMLIGLLQVVQRIEDAAPIRYLTQEEITAVLDADAYHYRALVETNERSTV